MFVPEVLRLLAITDDLRDGRDGLVARALSAVRGGATMVQLRLKDEDARTLVEVARALIAALPSGTPLIVNDRVDVALAAGAAGVHVGADDLSVEAVRRIAPQTFIIGASAGSDAEATQARGADYVGIGPVYETGSKTDAGAAIGVEELGRLIRVCDLPAVAIGGIDASNARAALGAGASGVAVIRAIFGAPDPEVAARALRNALAGAS
ncbi:MAG TPA: thiamine phosphate synthase [Gemmatimonadaceae bacterium]|nr:thiamine phosphate synthase [Gemmatimonadaceae bacterium]